MRNELTQATFFERGSDVLEYWLVHGRGFEVRGAGANHERVETVVVDAHRGRAKTLILRSTHRHRRRVVPADSVAAVDPFARVLHLADPERADAAGSAATAALLGALVSLRPVVSKAARLAAVHTRVAAARTTARLAWLRPRLGAAAGALIAAATRILHSLATSITSTRVSIRSRPAGGARAPAPGRRPAASRRAR